MKFKTQYDRGDKDYKFTPTGKDMCNQAEKDSCDINNILKRFEKTGMLPEMIEREPRYGDFSEVPDYQQACEIVERAEAQFMALDAGVRSRFANDPSKFLEFMHDEKNVEEIVKMGLATKKETKPEVAPAPSPAAPQVKA